MKKLETEDQIIRIIETPAIAVDPEVIDIGSRVLINGIVFTAEDTGGGVKGDHIDIFVDSHEETIKKGVQHTNIWVVRGKEYGE